MQMCSPSLRELRKPVAAARPSATVHCLGNPSWLPHPPRMHWRLAQAAPWPAARTRRRRRHRRRAEQPAAGRRDGLSPRSAATERWVPGNPPRPRTPARYRLLRRARSTVPRQGRGTSCLCWQRATVPRPRRPPLRLRRPSSPPTTQTGRWLRSCAAASRVGGRLQRACGGARARACARPHVRWRRGRRGASGNRKLEFS
mmetsp:Transcript_122904/g.393722  ORF Transcript_122904/g.393722 Transcript_122904/m.393722 type:complete len:200 (-) Transcript_122904:5-604(-)